MFSVNHVIETHSAQQMREMQYASMKLSELREAARSQGLRGWTALRRDDLREFLINNGARPSTLEPEQVPSTPNINVLLENLRGLES